MFVQVPLTANLAKKSMGKPPDKEYAFYGTIDRFKVAGLRLPGLIITLISWGIPALKILPHVSSTFVI